MTRQTLSRLLVQALILFLAVAGSIGALLTGFAIPIPPAVLITAAALSLLLPVVLHAPRRGVIFVGLILLLGIVLFALQDVILSGGTTLINLGLTHLNDTMNWSFTLLSGSAAMTPQACVWSRWWVSPCLSAPIWCHRKIGSAPLMPPMPLVCACPLPAACDAGI